jgi:tRNA(Ile)-lysidine synthase
LQVASLAARVLGAIQRQRPAPGPTRLVVALSGGGDSVALLLILRTLHDRGDVVLAGAAHLNHRLRAREADEDEAFCRALVERLGVPFIAEHADIRGMAREQKRSIEDTARRARYAFLERAADAVGGDLIATAHTRDDQAETFLLRILRGAGTRGLGSIHPRAGRIIRPLLDVGREELRAFLAEQQEPFREDETNADVAIPRNRVRHELIPLLRARFSAAVAGVLAREAELARRDEDFLQQQAIDLASRIVLSENEHEIRVAVAPMAAAHAALSSRAARTLLDRFAGGRAIAFHHIERVLELAQRTSDGAVSLPGQEVVRAGETLRIRPAPGRLKAPANSFVFSLSIPGEVTSDGWTLTAREAGPDRPVAASKWMGRAAQVGIAGAPLALPLAVRNRRPGDRFRPLGAPGKRKLQDFLVDRKVPRVVRDVLPIVVDARDRIVWVPGQAVAEEFRVSDASQAVILLTMRGLGLSGG